jgi:hypothetical protein
MPNYDDDDDDDDDNNNKKLMERDLTCLTWHGDGEIFAKGMYGCIYGHNNPHMCNCDNSKLNGKRETLTPLPHMAWHGMAWWWRNFCKRYI